MAGYDVLLATHHRSPLLVAARARLMLERQVDGLIVADGGGIASAPVPVVRIKYNWDGRSASSASLVALNLGASADAAIRHVVDLGHRRLALLSAGMPIGWSWGRALTRAARHIGVRIDTRGTHGGNVCAFDRGYLAARDLIASRTSHYTALFASDDDSAMGVIKALREHDLDVPGDVSVVGFGGHMDAAAYTPRLTTVRVPSQQAGECAARMIVGRIEQRPSRLSDRSLLLSAAFSVLETTGNAPSRVPRCVG